MATNGENRRKGNEPPEDVENRDPYDEAFEKYLESRRKDEFDEDEEASEESEAEVASYDADGDDVTFVRRTVTMGDFGAQRVHRERREITPVEETEGRSHKFHVKRSLRPEEPKILQQQAEADDEEELDEYEYEDEETERRSLVLPLSFALLAASSVLLGIPGTTRTDAPPTLTASAPIPSASDDKTTLSRLNYDALPTVEEPEIAAPPRAEAPRGVAPSEASSRNALIDSLPPPVVLDAPTPALHPPSVARAVPSEAPAAAPEELKVESALPQVLDTLPVEPPSLVRPTTAPEKVAEPKKASSPTSDIAQPKRDEDRVIMGSTLVVQITAATSPEVARRLSDSLIEQGFPSEVRNATVNGRPFWRVVVPVTTREEGAVVAKSLKSLPFVKDQPIVRDMR